MKQFTIPFLFILFFHSSILSMEEPSFNPDDLLNTLRKMLILNICKCACFYERFGTREELENHVKNDHFQSDIFTCPKCKVHFLNLDTIMEHFPKHTKEIIYSCNFCKIDFSKMEDIQAHYKLHQKYHRVFEYFRSNKIAINIDSKFPCPICRIRHFKKVGFLLRHIHISHSEYFDCEDQVDAPNIIEPQSLVYTDHINEEDEKDLYILAPFNPQKALPTSALKPLNIYKYRVHKQRNETGNLDLNLNENSEPNSWSSETNRLIKLQKRINNEVSSNITAKKHKKSSFTNAINDMNGIKSNDSAWLDDFIRIYSDSEPEGIKED